MKQFFFLFIILLVLATCRETFDTPPQPRLGVAIKYSSGASGTPLVSAFSQGLDSIWIKEERASTISLPLRIDNTSNLTVVIDSVADILEFTHEYTINYESMTSGFFYMWELSQIAFTTNRIDSILVHNPIITDKWNENITIYINDLPVNAGNP